MSSIIKKDLEKLPQIKIDNSEYLENIAKKNVQTFPYLYLKGEQNLKYENEKGVEDSNSKNVRLVIKDKDGKADYILKLRNDDKSLSDSQREGNLEKLLATKGNLDKFVNKNKSEDVEKNKKFLIENVIFSQHKSIEDKCKEKFALFIKENEEKERTETDATQKAVIKEEISKLKKMEKKEQISFLLEKDEIRIDDLEVLECEVTKSGSLFSRWTTWAVLAFVLTIVIFIIEWNYRLFRKLFGRIKRSFSSAE